MKRNKAPKRQTLLQGAAVLLGALAVVKVLGALFKIPLSWILTPVGSAYFGSAYALYFPIYSLAVAGLSGRRRAEWSARARGVRAACAACAPCGGVCVRLFFLLGLLAFGAMVLLSFPYARPDRAGGAGNGSARAVGAGPRPRFSAACSPFTAAFTRAFRT